jgi:hypothetical protein
LDVRARGSGQSSCSENPSTGCRRRKTAARAPAHEQWIRSEISDAPCVAAWQCFQCCLVQRRGLYCPTTIFRLYSTSEVVLCCHTVCHFSIAPHRYHATLNLIFDRPPNC